jgi:integrase
LKTLKNRPGWGADAQLWKKGEKSKCGLRSGTVNRHFTFIGQIFDHGGARGLGNLNKIDLSELRTKSKREKRDRDERLKLPIERALAIFRTPPFNNCADWNALGKPGLLGAQQIFHCALYYVPILIHYTGCRREELSGLMVDDVIVDDGRHSLSAHCQKRTPADQERAVPAQHSAASFSPVDLVVSA